MGWWQRSTGSTTAPKNPQDDTIVTFYFADMATQATLISSATTATLDSQMYMGRPADATDIKIVIDTTDQSYTIYRNSNVGDTPSWVEVSRCYLSNQSV